MTQSFYNRLQVVVNNFKKNAVIHKYKPSLLLLPNYVT